MKQAFAKPFQLYELPLFQFALGKIAPDCYYSFQKYHHLIVDGWAISLIVQRMASAYNALATGQSGCEQKPRSYKDFLQNDQAYLNSEKFAKAKRYWLDKYRQIPEPLLTRHYVAQFADQITPSQAFASCTPITQCVTNPALKTALASGRCLYGSRYNFFTARGVEPYVNPDDLTRPVAPNKSLKKLFFLRILQEALDIKNFLYNDKKLIEV